MFGSALLIALLLGSKDVVKSVRIVELRIPNHEREGGATVLDCQYDMEGDVLYAVKWYKDGNEFYRYAPKNVPPIKHFTKPGVYVDESRSSGAMVALVNLTQDSEGLYRCEVAGEAPKFTTALSQKYISIHFLPETGPHVTGLQERYAVDDLLVSNCTSPASRPKAHLNWLVNDRPVPEKYLRDPWYRVPADRPDLVEYTLQLRFRTTPSDFINGAIYLKCQATIAPLYQRETSSVHYVALPFTIDKPTAPLAADNIGYAIKVKQSMLTLLLPILLLIVVI